MKQEVKSSETKYILLQAKLLETVRNDKNWILI